MLRSIALVAACGTALGLVSWEQPAAARQDGFPPGVHAASDNCRACHSGKDAIGARGYVEKLKSHEFVLLDESLTWDAKDPHSRAHDVLGGDLGQLMKRNLGYAVENDARCLTCHATDLKPQEKMKSPTDFHTREGVACAACHGLKDEWQVAHWKEERDGSATKWRALSPTDKSKAGMTELRNPSVRAGVCASCHVGSAELGRVVTHDMYAAGHPPLPPFELATFQNGEPPHWAHPTSGKLPYFKEDPAKPAGWEWALFRFHRTESAAARDVAAGAIASLLAEAKQLEADAADSGKETWQGVDFARFDCYACHHDLQPPPSDRQKRGFPGRKPGRPPLKAWVSALPHAVADHAKTLDVPELKALAGEFAERWKLLNDAAVLKPFGDPAKLKDAAGAMAKWCDDFLTAQSKFDKPIYTAPEKTKLADEIRKAAVGEWAADPEAAFHLTWAYLRLTEAAPGELAKVVPPEVRAAPFDEPFGGVLGKRATTAQFRPRMDVMRAFKSDAFRAAFPK